jgi:two-component system, LytTR family, sensor histidine kinase AgrC
MRFNKKHLILINLILAQTFFNIFFICLYDLEKKGLARFDVFNSWFFISVEVVLAVSTVIILKGMMKLINIEIENTINITKFEESHFLIDTLQEQRHDFVNHLQVIYGLAQLNKPKEIGPYIHQVTYDFEKISKITSIKHTPLAAFLVRKEVYAQNRKIQFEMDIDSCVDEMPLSSPELVSLIGNLVDNAIFAAQEGNEESPLIKVEVKKDDGFIVKVFNTGKPIPHELKLKIFEKGFTTKGAKGSGLGLDIVIGIVNKYHGFIDILSDSRGTTFIIKFI